MLELFEERRSLKFMLMWKDAILNLLASFHGFKGGISAADGTKRFVCALARAGRRRVSPCVLLQPTTRLESCGNPALFGCSRLVLVTPSINSNRLQNSTQLTGSANSLTAPPTTSWALARVAACFRRVLQLSATVFASLAPPFKLPALWALLASRG